MKLFTTRRHFTRLFKLKQNKTTALNRNLSKQLNLQINLYKQLFDNYPEGIAILDNSDRIINVNKKFEQLFDYNLKEIKGCNINQLLVPDPLHESLNTTYSLLTGKMIEKEYQRKRKDDTLINLSILTFPIIIENTEVGYYAIYNDLSEQKLAEKKLLHLGIHDSLTGLYNRAFFEEQMKNYDLRIVQAAMIICDINGLKIINDSLGHQAGDSLLVNAAKIIKSSVRNTDVVARIGGDEFAILLPYSCQKEVEQIGRRIKKSVSSYNLNSLNLPLSLSLGWAVAANTVTTSMNDLFKEADNHMYREKIGRSQNTRKLIVESFMSSLKTKDFLAEGHVERLQNILQSMGKVMELPASSLKKLNLLAKYHDIGKVGVANAILFKKSPLTPREIKEIQWHSEIGCRIAHSASNLIPIGDLIHKHHEWWNGAGYPLGLAGENIPLECRIFALADAFEAMVNFRPYREKRTPEEAIEEIKKGAGTQFDPYLINNFLCALQEIESKSSFKEI